MKKPNNKGAALPFVIIVFAVLMLFGAGLLRTQMSEGTTAIKQEKQVQARYAAESAVQTVANFISNEANESHPFVVAVNNMADGEVITSSAVTGFTVNESQVQVTITKVSGQVMISASGEVQASNADVAIVMDGSSSDTSSFFEDAIHTGSGLNLEGIYIVDGHASYDPDSVIVGDTDVVTEGVSEKVFSYPEPSLPSPLPPSRGSLEYKNSSPSFDMTPDVVVYDTLTVKKPITINIPSGTEKTLVVDTLEDQDGFTITGGGRLIIYIISSGEFKKKPVVEGNDPNNFLIMAMEGATIDITANDGFNGFIYGPSAEVSLATGNAEFHGALIAETFNFDPSRYNENNGNYNGPGGSNAEVYFVPFDATFDLSVLIQNGYEIDHWE